MSTDTQPDEGGRNSKIEQVSLDELNWSDEKLQVMPTLPEDEYSSLKNKIETEGFDEAHPIIVDKEGIVIDGHHRCGICNELSIDTVFISRREDLSHEEKIKSSYRENTARRNLGNGEKREAAKNFYLNYYNGESIREVAELVGVSRGTVSNARDDLVEIGDGGFRVPSNLDTQSDTEMVEEREPSNLDTTDVEDNRIERGGDSDRSGESSIRSMANLRRQLRDLEDVLQAIQDSTERGAPPEKTRNEFQDWLKRQRETNPEFVRCPDCGDLLELQCCEGDQ